MTFHLLAQIAFWCATVPTVLFSWNLFFFRRPPSGSDSVMLPKLSVLIPARNEEGNIGEAAASVLASTGVDLELIVLDDGSTDRTPAIVSAIAEKDARLRCIAAPALAAGWAGKAHAAHVLSSLAKHDVLCFLDADVRVAPDALARMLLFMAQTRSELVSGFPEELTVTPLEWLLLPLIQFLLLGYLPMAGLRYSSLPGFGAGCGQFVMMSRRGYAQTGGYASVRTTMHDGIVLSKLFRKHRLHTDIADLTGLATCRMYRNASEVWQGLIKNATEGIAAPGRIVPFTLLLLGGQVLPWVLLFAALLMGNANYAKWMVAACALSLLPRIVSVFRFRQRWMGAVLHPVGIAIFLVLQWVALLRRFRKVPATWKGRAFEVG